MSARCETVGKHVMPIFRSLVAKELVNTYRLTQIEAAQKLGTTQAAISQYINSKRAFKGTEQLGDVVSSIQAEAKKTAGLLAEDKVTWEAVTADFCKLCATITVAKPCKSPEDYAI